MCPPASETLCQLYKRASVFPAALRPTGVSLPDAIGTPPAQDPSAGNPDVGLGEGLGVGL